MEHQLNISIIAPRGTGKTTLIGALYEYACSEIKYHDRCKFEVLKEYKSKLDKILRSLREFRETLKPTYGTNEIESFSFRYIIDGYKINVNFVDVPGGFTENAQYGSPNPEYCKFYEHLKYSPVLIIPIDTPCLMEGDEGQKTVALDTYNVGDLIKQWAQFRRKSGNRSVLHFVMLKSEYYNYNCEQKNVFEVFSRLYEDVIFKVWCNCCQKLEINYTPIEVFGNIHFDKANSVWENNQYCEKFRKVAPISKTKGLEDLWETIEDFVEESRWES